VSTGVSDPAGAVDAAGVDDAEVVEAHGFTGGPELVSTSNPPTPATTIATTTATTLRVLGCMLDRARIVRSR